MADIHDLRTLQYRQRVLLAEFQHRTRNLLARADRGGIDLGGLVTAELTAHGNGMSEARTRVDGPTVSLPAISAQPIGLALHELGTTALKYGALRQSDGRFAIVWRVDGDGAKRCLTLDWTESGVHRDAASG